MSKSFCQTSCNQRCESATAPGGVRLFCFVYCGCCLATRYVSSCLSARMMSLLGRQSCSQKRASFEESSRVNPLDVYTSKDVVENLGEMIHQILVALGASRAVGDVSVEGCTFRDWTSLYLEHMEMTLTLPALSLQCTHLDVCHGMYLLSALRKISARFRDVVVLGASAPEKTLEGGLLREDEEPIARVFAKRRSREAIADLTMEVRDLLPGFKDAVSANPAAGSSSGSAQMFVLPKHSQLYPPSQLTF